MFNLGGMIIPKVFVSKYLKTKDDLNNKAVIWIRLEKYIWIL